MLTMTQKRNNTLVMLTTELATINVTPVEVKAHWLYNKTLNDWQRQKAREMLGDVLRVPNTTILGTAIDFLEGCNGNGVWFLLDVRGDNGETGWFVYRQIPKAIV